jgi:hypothetical protein
MSDDVKRIQRILASKPRKGEEIVSMMENLLLALSLLAAAFCWALARHFDSRLLEVASGICAIPAFVVTAAMFSDVFRRPRHPDEHGEDRKP